MSGEILAILAVRVALAGLILTSGRGLRQDMALLETMKPITCLVAAASLCVGVGAAHAQSAFFLRLAPEAGRITVEHTKKVTIEGESSSSTSSSSSLALASNLSERATRLIRCGQVGVILVG